MSQEILTFFVYEPLKDSVLKAISTSLHGHVQTFTCPLDSLFTDPKVAWHGSAHYVVVIIPSDIEGDSFSPSEELLARFSLGLARLIVCGDETGLYLPVPYTSIASTLDETLQRCLWSHVCRFPGWGLTTVLPAGAKLWSERLHSEKQIAVKTEQAMDFILQQQPAFTNRLLTLRLAVMTAMAFALSERFSQPSQKPAVFQMGLFDQLVMFSLRWTTVSPSWEMWQSPPLICQAMLSQTHASLVQLNTETNETELVLMFLPGQLVSESSSPTAVDFISSQRIRNSGDLINQASTFDFETFTMIPPAAATFANEPSPFGLNPAAKHGAKKESA